MRAEPWRETKRARRVAVARTIQRLEGGSWVDFLALAISISRAACSLVSWSRLWWRFSAIVPEISLVESAEVTTVSLTYSCLSVIVLYDMVVGSEEGEGMR